MTPTEALAIIDGYAGDHIQVRTRSGAEYTVYRDTIVAYALRDDADADYVYGYRTNGIVSRSGRRVVNTRDQVRWFSLSNCTHVS